MPASLPELVQSVRLGPYLTLYTDACLVIQILLKVFLTIALSMVV